MDEDCSKDLQEKNQAAISLAIPSLAVFKPLVACNALTQREEEVLRFLADGLTNEQIAARLVINRRTVNAHLRSIFGKLGVRSRTAAARYALDHHLI